jgi:putative Mn2+ efflux pump MntP
MSVATSNIANLHPGTGTSLYSRLNSEWHKRSLHLFMIVVLAHWAEHLTQAVQIYVLGWPRPQAGGVLGLFFPFLVSSEILHYGYAIVMLIGIWMLRKGFTGLSRKWWTVALVIQFWHHIEHALLQSQVILHHNLLNSPVPVSFLQMAFPKNRVEIHLFYNAIVFIPMMIGMYYHMFPPAEEQPATCTCALHRQPIAA